MGLTNPVGRAKAEKYIYLPDPSHTKKIAELEALLHAERAKPPREVIKEVEKTVLKDEGLLEKLNAAQKELALMRGERSANVQFREIIKPEIREVVKTVEVVRIQRVLDQRLIGIFAAAAFLAGLAVGYFI